MKIVIQTGEHIGRKELEYFISIIPITWKNYFETIVVYGSREKDLKITYYQKNKALGVHCPSKFQGSSNDILKELAIGLVSIQELDHIPDKLSSSKRNEYINIWEDIESKVNENT